MHYYWDQSLLDSTASMTSSTESFVPLWWIVTTPKLMCGSTMWPICHTLLLGQVRQRISNILATNYTWTKAYLSEGSYKETVPNTWNNQSSATWGQVKPSRLNFVLVRSYMDHSLFRFTELILKKPLWLVQNNPSCTVHIQARCKMEVPTHKLFGPRVWSHIVGGVQTQFA